MNPHLLWFRDKFASFLRIFFNYWGIGLKDTGSIKKHRELLSVVDYYMFVSLFETWPTLFSIGNSFVCLFVCFSLSQLICVDMIADQTETLSANHESPLSLLYYYYLYF